ncbi:MAG: 3-phosphoshikimate 1-carboxyvinyltransferase [Nitrososphaerota archaeon]|nr:3-phosphoshikimate 1-carboxyvinyltransferase [Nitrososphaerota archaeon]
MIAGRPKRFRGKLRLPPSKSYLHRALFIASLGSGSSEITNCGTTFSEDILATMDVLRAFGTKIERASRANGALKVTPGTTKRPSIRIFARASGTTARFAIAYAALSKGKVILSGDETLSRRPMQSIFESLAELGVRCSYENEVGKLPVLINGGGIKGGDCSVDGSISSQFISSLLISCTRARSDCLIRIKDPTKLVSKPYIDATLAVLSHFGLVVEPLMSEASYAGFRIIGNQVAKPSKLAIPGDMSSAAAIIGTTLAADGSSDLQGINESFPQSDAAFIPIAERFGALIQERQSHLSVKSKRTKSRDLEFDLKESPDIVPVVAGLAAALGRRVKISNVGHLRFKESDRLSVLSRELRKLGVKTRETQTTLAILDSNNDSRGTQWDIVIDPAKDHRMLMALTIAGLSGRYGKILIRDPDCVRKSYPTFVRDMQKMCGEKETIKILEVSR